MKNDNYILGLNAYGFNTSATLLKNGILIGAIEEERLSREKRTRKFPINSIKYLLNLEKIKIENLKAIAISWNPSINLEKFDKNKSENLTYLPDILHSVPNHLIKLLKNFDKKHFKQEIIINKNKSLPIYYVNHHLSHASNFYFSPFKNSSILTVDAFGENQTTSFYKGGPNSIELLWKQEFPHSLGSFYSTFTEFCGFAPQNDEWKLMGASAYGNSNKYYKKIKALVDLIPGKGFELNLKYFNHYLFHRPKYYNEKLSEYLNVSPNIKNNLNKNYYDICAASQKVFEETYFHLMNSLYKMSKNENLVVSGGCALNCLANGKILSKTKFKNIFVPPMPDDSGAGTGAAYYVHKEIFKSKSNFVLKHNFLGPSFSNKNIIDVLKRFKLKYVSCKDPTLDAAISISKSKIIGWFQDRIEFGDRALGNRSILADPRKKDMKDRVNLSVKYRENFRPFAPAVLEEYSKNFFENNQKSVFMEKTLKIKKIKRDLVPAVTHEDGTGRLQTVNKKNNQKFYKLINNFYKITNIPIVLNTSLNYKGDPMACSPEDAVKTFYLSGLDELYMGNLKIFK